MSKIPVKNITPDEKSLYVAREKIQVREIHGIFQKIRSYSLWGLMALFFATSWLSWGDRQAILFDLPARQFHFFGITFWPQDFFLLSGLLIISAYGLFTVTNLAGRVWCGYTCPQSSWSFVFMWIEEKTEGTRNKRMKMDKAPMSLEKFLRRGSKHVLWLLLALATGLTFVSYFSPVRELVPNLLTFNLNSWEAFWIGFFGLATYLNAGWLREQVCIHMCPYARFQSVMFDQDTLIVSYDEKRGEGEKGRGARKKGVDPQAEGLGDCIDCSLCVQVCPTGIDIRDGLQYQCIGCALCIDACDSIMDKMGYEPGLVRYTTEHELEGGTTHFMRPRLIGYALVLLLMISGLVYAMVSRTAFELDIIRDRGSLYQLTPNDTVANSYTLEMMNMSQHELEYRIKIEGLKTFISDIPETVILHSNELRAYPFTIEVDPVDLKVSKTDIEIIIYEEATQAEVAREESRFIAPLN
ncbi:Polyferredoxin [Oleispira antarctica RB-8]|uniref:Polyferredoxin n=1 Tax=Oleispira antarctica RB-8 TaxID=698738 RepID=R4YM10_OLEAN|nr:Polyferredoxin [Oleispira antarctica RB-8]|tara:strand:- start:1211 stop:2614 length:1404 start_codon:yes stop_codon:yes gene_type:complete